MKGHSIYHLHGKVPLGCSRGLGGGVGTVWSTRCWGSDCEGLESPAKEMGTCE